MSSVWLSDQHNVHLNSFCFGYRQDGSFDNLYLAYMLRARVFRKQIEMLAQGISRFNISKRKVMELKRCSWSGRAARDRRPPLLPVDELITLHQRKPILCFFLAKTG